MNLIKTIRKCRWRNQDKRKWEQDYKLQIGSFVLLFPKNHHLGHIYSKYPKYDQALGKIAKIVGNADKSAWFVDVGANVGDTLARMRANSVENPILAFEGHPDFLPYLEANVKLLGNGIVIEPSFVGVGSSGESFQLETTKGTARLVDCELSDQRIYKFCSLEDVIAKQSVRELALLKIDTDGMDFKILLTNEHVLQTFQPVCFFEYAPWSFAHQDEAVATVEMLVNLGYRYFIVYDNFGFCLQSFNKDVCSHFKMLNHYLGLCQRYKGSGIQYFDVCAIPHDKEHIFNSIIETEQARNFSENL